VGLGVFYEIGKWHMILANRAKLHTYTPIFVDDCFNFAYDRVDDLRIIWALDMRFVKSSSGCVRR
jgi:hypothetical protein